MRPLAALAGAVALVMVGMAVLGPGVALGGIATSPALGGDAGRAVAAALDAAERRAAHAVLTERHARLLRERSVLVAAQRSAELRLRRLVVDFAALAEARAAADALTLARADEVRTRQHRLEALLAEIVQLSRDESGDPRRLAQLRAVASALAQPFAEAKRALAESRSVVLAHERREARLLEASIDARQALIASTTRQVWLSDALDDVLALATEAAERAVAASRMATLTTRRLERAEEGRRLAALPLPVTRAGKGASVEPAPRRLEPRGLTAQAGIALRPVRAMAHFDLAPTVALARGPAGGQLMPVAGAVVGRFGDGQKAPFDRGLTIEVAERRLVRAPRDGRVVFARAYEGFGLLLIIDHGNEYHSLLSGLSRFVVHEGWAVRAGQMVGTLEPGAEAVGRLYVELRLRGVPVDPLAWFAAGQDKVRS